MKYTKVEPITHGMDMPMGSKGKKVYPSISIPLSALPEAEKWQPGKTYHIALEIDMKSLRMEKNEDGKRDDWGNSAGFDIKGIAVIPNEGPAKKERKSRMY